MFMGDRIMASFFFGLEYISGERAWRLSVVGAPDIADLCFFCDSELLSRNG